MISDLEKASKAALWLDKPVSLLLVELGQERLRALQSAGQALDQRCSQTSAFQFAAAAVAAALLSQSGPTAFLAGLSSLCFIVGGVIAFRGIRSDRQHLPGLPPAWWYNATEEERFTGQDARSWLASATEEMICFNERENNVRGDQLNLSLRFAIGGASLVGLAAFVRAFG